MTVISKLDIRAAQAAVRTLLDVMPKSAKAIHNIAYTSGLIFREAGIPLEQATDLIVAWSERLNLLPNFNELFPEYKKPSVYRYQIRYAVTSAYKRAYDMPSSTRFKALTGKNAPSASFWDNMDKPEKPRKFSRPAGRPAFKKNDKLKGPIKEIKKTSRIKPSAAPARIEKPRREMPLIPGNLDDTNGVVYLDPIGALIEKLEKISKGGVEEAGPENPANGYCRSICLLATACVESYVMRTRTTNKNKPEGGDAMSVPDYLEKLYPDFPFKGELSDALQLRDRIVHYRMSGINSAGAVAKEESLHVSPSSVDASDVTKVLHTVWNTLIFLENKDNSQCLVSNVTIKYKGKNSKFGKVIGLPWTCT